MTATVKFTFPRTPTRVQGYANTPQVLVGDRAVCTADDVYYVAEILTDPVTRPDMFECYDGEFIDAWRRDEWCYVGVEVKAYAARGVPCVELASASIWGVESVSVDYIDELAADLAHEMKDEAEETRQRIIDSLSPPFSSSRWLYDIGRHPDMITTFSCDPFTFAEGFDPLTRSRLTSLDWAFALSGCIDAPDSPLSGFTARNH